jgi:dimethylargininase
MLRNEGDKLTKVVVSTPGEAYFDESTHVANNIPESPEPAATRKQHDKLKQVLAGFGTTVIDVPELAGHPNSVFPRDVALCTPQGHVRLHMGIEARRGEETWMSGVLESLGEPCVGEIAEPGTVEGGDLILMGAVAFVGLSGRTNAAGADQIARLLRNMDYEVRLVPVGESHLHLGGVMSAIGPATIVCARAGVPVGLLSGFEVIEVQNAGPSPGNVICLGDGELVVNHVENQAAAEELDKRGFTVHSLDLSEFRKGGGGPTCLILPLGRN